LDLTNYISSGVLESFVLGTATPEEIKLVNDLCKKHPEVLLEIEEIENALITLAKSNAPKISNSHKVKLFSILENTNNSAVKTETVIHTLNSNQWGFRSSYYKIAIAASVTLLIMSSLCNIYFYTSLQHTQLELQALNNEKNYYTEQLKVQKTSLKNAENNIALLSNPDIKVIKLNSTEAGKQLSALIYWDEKNKVTYINSIQLPAPPEGKQYQLWALVDGKPIDAGVFDITSNITSLQKMKAIRGAQTFAVTLEIKGGSPNPTLTAMFLLGNV
jgi:anti-sigma-K factor RskA